jgi:hypothetical protein
MAQSDNIPAMLQSGEYVVRKEAVDKLGKDTMDMINNADRLGYMGGGLVPQGEHGHSAIDELLALNTLANQKSVDMTRDSAMMNKGGKVLKKAPEGNKGLMKLPEEVRNRMGYMMEGGMMDNYMYGGMPKKKKKKGYEDGGSVGVVNEIGKARKMFSDIDELLATAALMDNYNFGPMQRKALGSMREADMVDPKDTMEQVMMLLKAREQNKIPSFEKRKSYRQGGFGGPDYDQSGSTTSDEYRGGSGGAIGTVSPSFLDRAFNLYGGRPEDADILNRITELYDFDPSVGAGEVQDMIGGYRSELTSFLPSVQQYGGGFEGFGGRQQAMQTARTGAYSGIDRAATDIASAEQDRQMAELIQYLTQLETQGGVEFTT